MLILILRISRSYPSNKILYFVYHVRNIRLTGLRKSTPVKLTAMMTIRMIMVELLVKVVVAILYRK